MLGHRYPSLAGMGQRGQVEMLLRVSTKNKPPKLALVLWKKAVCGFPSRCTLPPKLCTLCGDLACAVPSLLYVSGRSLCCRADYSVLPHRFPDCSPRRSLLTPSSGILMQYRSRSFVPPKYSLLLCFVVLAFDVDMKHGQESTQKSPAIDMQKERFVQLKYLHRDSFIHPRIESQ